MKYPNRVKRALKFIDQIDEVLHYYFADKYISAELDSKGKNRKVYQKVKYIKKLLMELSVDQRVHDAKLWNRFKDVFAIEESNNDN